MANEEHLALLKQGVEIWNQWRKVEQDITPNFYQADFRGKTLNQANFSVADFARANLSETDLSGSNLSGANLRFANLSGSNLSRSNLSRAIFRAVDLSGTNLDESILQGANLSHTDLRNMDFRGMDLSGTNLRGTNLSGTDLTGTMLRGADLSHTDLSNRDFSGMDLSGTNLSGTNLDGTTLQGADLSHTDLSNRNFTGMDLSGTMLRGADLSHTDLSNRDFSGMDLSETNLSGANLDGTFLQRTNLSDTDLSNRDFSGMDLSRINLSGTNLSGSKLYKADLSQADLRRSNLIDADLDSSTLTGAKLWETQRYGWSIKSVICDHAYWDRDAKEAIRYAPGEFERLHREAIKVALHYKGGMNRIEVDTLPLLIKHLEASHKGSILRLTNIDEAPGGATAIVTVDDTGGQEPATLQSALKEEAQKFQEAVRELQEERTLRLRFESQTEVLRQIVENFMAKKTQISIGQIGTVGSLGDISGNAHVNIDQSVNYNENDIASIKNVIAEILDHEAELQKNLPSDQFTELESSTQEIQEQLQARNPNSSIIRNALGSTKRILEGAAGNVVGSGLFQALQSLV